MPLLFTLIQLPKNNTLNHMHSSEDFLCEGSVQTCLCLLKSGMVCCSSLIETISSGFCLRASDRSVDVCSCVWVTVQWTGAFYVFGGTPINKSASDWLQTQCSCAMARNMWQLYSLLNSKYFEIWEMCVYDGGLNITTGRYF